MLSETPWRKLCKERTSAMVDVLARRFPSMPEQVRLDVHEMLASKYADGYTAGQRSAIPRATTGGEPREEETR